MPIIVNVPGGGLDTAGRGMAASQQYRGNEQKMQQIDAEAMRRDEAFELDKEIALRSMDLKEQSLQVEQEMLAQSQEAEADLLMGQAIEAGVEIGDQGAYRELLKRASPQFRSRMATELGRSARMMAEQRETESLMGRIENTPELAEIQKRAESGEFKSAADLRKAVEKAELEVAVNLQQQTDRDLAMAEWQKIQADPTFDMPDESDDAAKDVQERIAKLLPGAAPRKDVKYRQLVEELKLLTNRASREAARRILQAEMRNMKIPAGAMGDVMSDPAQSDYLKLERNIDKADEQRRQANEAPNVASDTPSPRLKQPIGEQEARSLYGAPSADIQSDFMKALKDLGMDKVPDPGTPEYETARRVLEAVKKKRAEAEKSSSTPERLPYPGGKVL